MGGLRSLDCAHSSLIPSICIAHLPFNQWHNLFYTAYLTVNAESHYCLQTVEGYLSLIQSLRPNLLTGWWEQSWQNGRLNLGGVLFWLCFLYRFPWFLFPRFHLRADLENVLDFKEYFTALITTTGEISRYVNLHMAKWCVGLCCIFGFVEKRNH